MKVIIVNILLLRSQKDKSVIQFWYMNAPAHKTKLYKLIKKEAFYKKRIVLSSGKISNYYIDVRKISLKSEGAFLIANSLWQELKKEKCTYIGGPTLGADPILSALAYHAYLDKKPIKTFIVRKKPKKYGQNKLIEGPKLKKGSKVIVIDDVATTGKSLLDAIKKLKSLKVSVKKAFVVVDREEGAKKALKPHKCPLISLFTLRDFIKG